MTKKSKNKLQTLYYLIDPRDNLVFYVGISSNVERRLKDHKKPKQKKVNFDKYLKICQIKKQNLSPILKPIYENLSLKEAEDLEKEAILAIRASGFSLLNKSDGGVIHISTPEEREMSRQRLLGNKLRKGIKHTKEALDKISASSKGKTISQSQKELTKKVNLEKYGVETTFGLPGVKEKKLEAISIKLYEYDTSMKLIEIHKNKKSVFIKLKCAKQTLNKKLNTEKIFKNSFWFTKLI